MWRGQPAPTLPPPFRLAPAPHPAQSSSWFGPAGQASVVGPPAPPVPRQAPGTHSQVVLPCMLTTHWASRLVSRALKGRTLTATFTEAPAMAPETLSLLS